MKNKNWWVSFLELTRSCSCEADAMRCIHTNIQINQVNFNRKRARYRKWAEKVSSCVGCETKRPFRNETLFKWLDLSKLIIWFGIHPQRKYKYILKYFAFGWSFVFGSQMLGGLSKNCLALRGFPMRFSCWQMRTLKSKQELTSDNFISRTVYDFTIPSMTIQYHQTTNKIHN